MRSSSSRSIPFKSKKTLHFQPDKPPPSSQPHDSIPNAVDQIESSGQQILQGPAHQSSSKTPSDDLPEKSRQLSEFFDSLDCAIRLLKLKRSIATFTNLAPRIKCLTDRRFSFGHLAQLKSILPEAIEIKKVVAFDEKTSCMKPDLLVSLNVDAIDCESDCKNKNMNLRKVFRARLSAFHETHPEGDEVPEEILPEPFSLSKPNLPSNMITNPTVLTFHEMPAGGLTDQLQISSSTTCDETKVPNLTLAVKLSAEQPAVASHLSLSFRRHFSQKFTHDAQNAETEHKSPKVSTETSVIPDQEACISQFSSGEDASSVAAKSTNSQQCLPICNSSACIPLSCTHATPIKELDPVETRDGSSVYDQSMQSTPAKCASTPARLIAATPALSHPPKRCHMSPENASTCAPEKLVRRAPRSRSLKFDTPVKNKEVETEFNQMENRSVDDGFLDILPDKLQSIREKEKATMEDCDPEISQAKRRRQERLKTSLTSSWN